MIEFKYMLGIFIVTTIVISLLSLVIWGVMLLFYMEEIDSYFDSPDFPNRGYKGLWPWEMGRAFSYGVFLLFPNSRFVNKKFPHACKNIKVDELPRKIKLMVAFPMYTNVPSSSFLLMGGVVLYIKKWLF
ncbi:hypothetical protein L861_22740 [Litchfieldella anticariensis FP35 = DSM 16096]|uniref:Uncharacterized protein n=1 Tax=Litchfieldella anticariensis (strain DSM 16096 / CECT 5854 / CIP 108499 / LMG 22089 / FP35) TaxID=1121939 RepID=S2KMI1_LITA3|nr:hypothetical protein [Halomonas anticariensis]EPC03130.1 hypothetical protein L861_22740 [Halomonas anticariensis FP35 = DSM 16096]